MRCARRETCNAAAAPATVSGERGPTEATGGQSRREGRSKQRPASQETCHRPWSRASASGGVHRWETGQQERNAPVGRLQFAVTCHHRESTMSSPVPLSLRRIAALSLVLVLSAVPLTRVFAQDASVQQAASDFGTMQPIVVTPTLFPVPPTQIGSDVTVITADDIARKQANDLPTILRDVPGLSVMQSSPGNVASLFIRGANANHTKF